MSGSFEIRHLSFTYPQRTEPALTDVSLEIRAGEFWVLCGPSGCGKTTLLRQLKPALTPHGVRTGEIDFEGRSLEEMDRRTQAQRVGFVLQSPENQLVTDKVWHELAFGLESLGFDTPVIRRRVAEMASFFGIESWFYQDVDQLSGGQKQLLNLASVMTLQPSVLILDEPTSQLDPIAAGDFLAVLGKINRELGTTILLTEHRLEEALPLADRAAVMDRGRVLFAGAPGEVGAALRERGHATFLAMPAPMRIWAAVPDAGGVCPITVREGRDWLTGFALRHPLKELPPERTCRYPQEAAIEARDLWFKYDRELPDAVKGLSLTVKQGELLALLGGNGAGKTTALKLLAGALKPYRGELEVRGSVGLLPQDPQTLFVKKTVREDLLELWRDGGRAGQQERVAEVVRLCRLEELLDRHPYDLSGGEQQRAALAKVLLLEPRILLLDEPTKGLDAEFKEVLAQILRDLCGRGTAVLMVSHDVEFCARYAHRCALLFDGNVATEAPPRAFFSGNSFYTTSANRMARELCPEAVTAEDVIALCGGATPPSSRLSRSTEPLPEPDRRSAAWWPEPLPLWRKVLAAVCALAAVLLLFQLMNVTDLSQLVGRGGIADAAQRQLVGYALFSGALVVMALAVGRRSPPPKAVSPPRRSGLSKRTAAAVLLTLLLIPATLFCGEYVWGGRKTYFISLLVMLECMTPFFLVFEGRRPRARELVLVAALCAIGVAGRLVFFMLPEFKPVMALVIVSGIALGWETGFLVGATTMLLSNAASYQGPWTPWQMFAMGLVGCLAGVLFQKGLLRRSRGSMCTFGALASIVVYGGIMNFQSALAWSHTLNWGTLLSYYVTGFPMDCVHAAATWVFLWFGGEAMLEKLDRIKVKYGLAE